MSIELNKIYHISNNLYKDLRPLKLQDNGLIKIQEMMSKGYSKEYIDKYGLEVNFFFNPITKEHIEKMILNGFTNWNLSEFYLYTIDLHKLKDINYNYISVTSTKQQRDYDDANWSAFEKKYEHYYDAGDMVNWIKYKTIYATNRDKYLLDKFNIKKEMVIDELIKHPLLSDWLNFDKYFNYNLKHGNKKQYASYIPHIQFSVSEPIEYIKVEKIKISKIDREELIFDWGCSE